MRRDADGYQLMPDNDAAQLMKMRSECAALWRAIERIKKGTTPVLASHAKYLRYDASGCARTKSTRTRVRAGVIMQSPGRKDCIDHIAI